MEIVHKTNITFLRGESDESRHGDFRTHAHCLDASNKVDSLSGDVRGGPYAKARVSYRSLTPGGIAARSRVGRWKKRKVPLLPPQPPCPPSVACGRTRQIAVEIARLSNRPPLKRARRIRRYLNNAKFRRGQQPSTNQRSLSRRPPLA